MVFLLIHMAVDKCMDFIPKGNYSAISCRLRRHRKIFRGHPEPRQRTSSSALLLILEQARVLAREFKPAKDFVLCTPAD
jgi:hypothetical protein